jgi:hypothetical protein
MSFDHLVITLTLRFMYAAKNHERIFRENRSEKKILFFFLSREFRHRLDAKNFTKIFKFSVTSNL